MSRLFQTHVIVDWSARSCPSPRRPSKDAIWIATMRDGVRDGGEPEIGYLRTRAEAVERLATLLGAELAAGRRVLVGFDFPFGYPEGVAERLTGRAEARALWDWLAARVEDAPDNSNNRFRVAEEINRHFDGIGPCWGRPAGWLHPDLPVARRARRGALPPERRRADGAANAKTVWQTAYAGSVGGQALLGIPALRRLAADPRLGGRVRDRVGQRVGGQLAVWPLDTGLAVPEAPLVIAEVYPSLLAGPVRAARAPGEVRDRAQVRLTAAAFARLDAAGGLAPLFLGPTDACPADRAAIEREEGWILGLGHVAALSGALSGVLSGASGEAVGEAD